MNAKLKKPIYSRTRLKVIKNPEWTVLHLPEKETAKTPAQTKKCLMPEPAQGYIKAKDHDCL